MKKFKFICREADTPIITGGQIYDNKIFTILNKQRNFVVEQYPVETALSKKFLLLSPFLYALKAFKIKKDETIIFNSASYMRFLLFLIVLKLRGHRKTMTVHHHFLYEQFHGLKKKIYKPAEWFFLKLSDKLIIPSPYILSLVKDRIKDDRLLFWRIPFEKEKKHENRPIKGNLTFTGTIEERKGLKYLLEAIKVLQESKIPYSLRIIGKPTEESYFEALKDYINKNSLKVEFLGFLEKDEIEKIYSETDIFVFPSLLEGYGMVLIEAQTYGLPIVSFDNSAMPYSVLDGENGYTVPTGDYLKFADAIKKLIEDRELRTKMSDKAFENLKFQNTPENFEKEVTNYFVTSK